MSSSRYVWKNKAGRSWTIDDDGKLHEDFPYFNNHKSLRILTAANHAVVGVVSSGEAYHRIPGDLEGQYQCTEYIGTENENDWHHVTIAPKHPGAGYTWTNKAGASWSIGKAGTLSVDCPYYSSEQQQCEVIVDDASKVVIAVCLNGEQYDRVPTLAGTYQCTQYIGTPNENDWHHAVITDAQLAVPINISLPEDPRRHHSDCHAFIMETNTKDPDWRDYVYLSTIPVASVLNKGSPVVLLLGDTGDQDDDAYVDYLNRLRPSCLHIISSPVDKRLANVAITEGCTVSHIEIGDNDVTASSLAVANVLLAGNQHKVVIIAESGTTEAQYSSALLASSLASGIGCP
eukprot:PhF_6_TR39638/c0_g1_i1/m.58767